MVLTITIILLRKLEKQADKIPKYCVIHIRYSLIKQLSKQVTYVRERKLTDFRCVIEHTLLWELEAEDTFLLHPFR